MAASAISYNLSVVQAERQAALPKHAIVFPAVPTWSGVSTMATQRRLPLLSTDFAERGLISHATAVVRVRRGQAGRVALHGATSPSMPIPKKRALRLRSCIEAALSRLVRV